MNRYMILDETNWNWCREHGDGFWVRDKEKAVKYIKLSALIWVLLMRLEGVDARIWKVKK